MKGWGGVRGIYLQQATQDVQPQQVGQRRTVRQAAAAGSPSTLLYSSAPAAAA